MITFTPPSLSPPKPVLRPNSPASTVPSWSLNSRTPPPSTSLIATGFLVEAAPHWSWESARVTVVPRARYDDRDDGIHIPSLDDVGGVICGSI